MLLYFIREYLFSPHLLLTKHCLSHNISIVLSASFQTIHLSFVTLHLEQY